MGTPAISAHDMTRIAIIGGGISGLTVAYELEKARRAGAALDWQLFEAANRFGGTLETTHIAAPEGEYIFEGGPDGWVTEKPWARELASELGLAHELIVSNDATRKTYIYLDGQLQVIPDGMRLMVPEELSALQGSPLFSASAKEAYADEVLHAEKLKAESPLLDATHDESVASFVLRHFGPEVLSKLAAPLLSGVFGGDVEKLSVRAVMPQFVRMEREHGSLILALQHAKRERDGRPPQPIFTSLRRGMASLVDALVATLPPSRVHISTRIESIENVEVRWTIVSGELDRDRLAAPKPRHVDTFDKVVFATSLETTLKLLIYADTEKRLHALLPSIASSAVLVSMSWPAELARSFTIPQGFGFLVAQGASSARPALDFEPGLLAATFVDQKFPGRVPAGARILRAFFGSAAAEHFASVGEMEIAREALGQLAAILGPLPQPEHTAVRRWPGSLPQYGVGHLDRMAQLERLANGIPGLLLLGNSYRGVGVPDLIRDARVAARRLLAEAKERSVCP